MMAGAHDPRPEGGQRMSDARHPPRRPAPRLSPEPEPKATSATGAAVAADREGDTAARSLLALLVGAFLIIVSATPRSSSRSATSSATRGTSSPASADATVWVVVLRAGQRRGRVARRDRSARSSVPAPLICAGLGRHARLPGRPVQHRRPGPAAHRRALSPATSASPGTCPPACTCCVAMVAGLIGGALWGGIAGLLKARTGAHEVITTIMLNYLAGFGRCSTSSPRRPSSGPAATTRSRRRSTTRRDLPVASLGIHTRLPRSPSWPPRSVWWLLERSTWASSSAPSAPTRTPPAPPA